MTKHFAARAVTCLASTSLAAAAELAPASGHGIQLGRLAGALRAFAAGIGRVVR
jgi:hypothetical protein